MHIHITPYGGVPPPTPLPAAAQAAASKRVRDRYASVMRECYACGVFYLLSKKINEFKDI